MKLERDFQASLIRELKDLFDGCVVIKTDPNYIQGFPDLLVLYKDMWASLEVKQSARARYRPNQRYYLELLGGMSYAATIFPENREEILDELQQAFGTGGDARLSWR